MNFLLITVVSDGIFTLIYVRVYVAHSYHSAATELNSLTIQKHP